MAGIHRTDIPEDDTRRKEKRVTDDDDESFQSRRNYYKLVLPRVLEVIEHAVSRIFTFRRSTNYFKMCSKKYFKIFLVLGSFVRPTILDAFSDNQK